MTIYTIFFIFMITTSITLTGFVIRQRKNNRMLGELVAQTKVEQAQRYSSIGVGVQNHTYVSKCPACAEWINLEAKVCKSCQNSVDLHNLNLREEMRKIDESIAQAEIARAIHNKAQLKALLRNPFFRGILAVALVFTIVVVGIRIQSTLKYNNATATPSSASELAKSWNTIISECEFRGTIKKPRAVNEGDSLRLTIELGRSLGEFDWATTLGKEIRCFSDKALGIDVSKKLDAQTVNNIDLRNTFSIFGSYDYSYLAFYWNY